MNKFRVDVKSLILENSDNMKDICLFCGIQVDEHHCECRFCKRKLHKKCLIYRNEYENIKECGICSLCLLY